MQRREFLTALAGTGAAAMIPRQLKADSTRLTIHHFMPAASTAQQFLEGWGSEITQASRGRLTVSVHPWMTLGGQADELYDQVRTGAIDAAWLQPTGQPGRFPRAEVLELPFLCAQSAEATSLAVHTFATKFLLEEFAEVQVLTAHASGAHALHLRRRSTTRPTDLKEARIGVASSGAGAALAALGAVPVELRVPPLPETALQTSLNGVLLPYEAARSLRVQDRVQGQIEFGGDRAFANSVCLFAINRDRYQALAPDLRQIIDDHTGLDLAGHAGRVWDKAEQIARTDARLAGRTAIILDGEELERWQTATAPVTERWAADMNQRGLDGRSHLLAAKLLIDHFAEAQL